MFDLRVPTISSEALREFAQLHRNAAEDIRGGFPITACVSWLIVGLLSGFVGPMIDEHIADLKAIFNEDNPISVQQAIRVLNGMAASFDALVDGHEAVALEQR